MKLQLGDVFEIKTRKGLAYFQCVDIATDNNNVELIKVFYRLHEGRPENINQVLDSDFFFVGFPLKAAFRRKLVEKVNNSKLSEDFEKPIFFRIEQPFENGWHIVNSKSLYRTSIDTLTEEQKKISPWGAWNDTLLMERLEEGWRLDKWG